MEGPPTRTGGPAPPPLAGYVRDCGNRLRRLAWWRLSAAGLCALLVVTAGFAGAVVYWVPGPEWTLAARALLCATVVAPCILAWRLARRYRAPVQRIERTVPAFGGRLVTWSDARRRGRPSAIVGLLERETEGIAVAYPPQVVAPGRHLLAPIAALCAALCALAWLLAAAPTAWQLAGQRLWTGDLLADGQPRIVVNPGDVVVPRGADVVVRAHPWGFEPARMHVHAAFASGAGWESAEMVAADDGGAEFVLVSVTEPVEYYVGAGALNSARYTVEVADLPAVETFTLDVTWPEWTGKPSQRQRAGDVVGVDGTRVSVEAMTDLPLAGGHLVVDGEARPLAVDGRRGTGGFEIGADGAWHLAVLHEGALVRITDEFGIDLAVDLPPEVEFAFPGRDRSVTAIEEVALRFRARDDFGVEGLALHYSVNGEDAVERKLPVGVGTDVEGSDLLRLEAFSVPDGTTERALRPGDVVAFFAEARDRGHATRSALYFADVRPFERRYREQQGSGGGGSDGPGIDIAARQRDIVSATWNLIRERDSGARAGQELADRTDMLALLQERLMAQVDTLIERSEGRGLSASAEIDVFVTELAQARESMAPAVERLAEHALAEALPLEQKALQHALAAEAGLRDVNVTLSSEGQPGNGGMDRSLSELIDLEMDPERNRYEVPRQPGSGNGQPTDDTEWQRLAELARRQEALARSAGPEEMPVSRWQRERLSRELEELRERLARAGGGRSGRIDEAIERLDEARNAIDESLRGEADPAAQARIGEALREAAERLRDADRQRARGRLEEARRAVAELLRDQRDINERLQELQDRSLDAARRGERTTYDTLQNNADSETKRRMQREFGDTLRALGELLGELPERPGAALERALDDVSDARVLERMAAAAEVFDRGRPLYILGQEEFVEETLERFGERLGRIGAQLATQTPDGALEPGVARAQRLRRALEEAAGGADVAAMERVERLVGALELEVLGAGDAPDLASDRARYRGRGAPERNAERLYRMTLERLDHLEVMLATSGSAGIRAGEPRDDAYDSAEVARYFRTLSCGPDCD